MAALDFEWLEDFLEVARVGSMRVAADHRGINQSTLSRRIQSLERWLGTDLLDPDAARVTLTKPGLVFQKAAQALVIAVRDAKFEVEKAAPPRATRFYTLHTLSATFVPRVIGEIRKQLRDNELNTKTSLIVGNISECVEAIVNRTTPFMISYESKQHRVLFSDENLQVLYPDDPFDVRRERVQSIVIAEDKLIPVCPGKEHSKYKKMIQSKTPIPYSTYSAGTYLGELVSDKIKERQLDRFLTPEPVDDAQMADTLRNLVREGQGIAWVLHSTAQRAIKLQEVDRFDFGLGNNANIDLEIKLFRAADYSSPTIDRIWKIAGTLKDILSPGD